MIRPFRFFSFLFFDEQIDMSKNQFETTNWRRITDKKTRKKPKKRAD
jgi:hypothetical protein